MVMGERVAGPVIVMDPTGTTVVDPGWRVELIQGGVLSLEQKDSERERVHTWDAASDAPDPVRLEVFNNLIRSVAEEMGAVLQNTCRSVNIKERLDFSCAIFDREGELVTNAPHIPVHLGSMGDAVKSLIAARGREIGPGRVFVTNNPYSGGTHLPDITAVTPVYAPDGAVRPLFYVASRGHHADIGGATPGSMPSDSRSLDEEGVVLDHVLFVDGGCVLEDDMRRRLADGASPRARSRHESRRLAGTGSRQRARRSATPGDRRPLWPGYRGGLHGPHPAQRRGVRSHRAIEKLDGGSACVELDDGSHIRVRVELDRSRRGALLDFTGTSEQHPGNHNAPPAVTRAAVLYVFRTLVEDDIPLNSGSLRPIRLRIPPGCMLDPAFPAAVAAGNVETSQAIVDTIYAALGILAGSQGTMNNLTFGKRARAILRDHMRGRGRRARFRWRKRRPYAHDKHALNRSGSAGVALSGATR